MMGVYGYDLKTESYWYHINNMGIEVAADRHLTRKEMDEIKNRYKFVSWYKENDWID